MKARLVVELPFSILLKDGAEYKVWVGKIDRYTVAVYPPATSSTANHNQLRDVTIDGDAAFFANVAVIEFQCDDFDRPAVTDACDPPYEILNVAIRSFVERYKFVTECAEAQAPQLPFCNWRIDYTDDNGGELPREEGKARGRFGREMKASWNLGTNDVWTALISLPAGFEPPTWHTLLLDAKHALPHVGTSIVLTAVALEVFISELVERLAASSSIPSDVWRWIHERDHWMKGPSVDENFGPILKALTGHSLEDEPELSAAFTKIRRARNNFAHAGVVTAVKKRKPDSPVLTTAEVGGLIEQAFSITRKVREWVPESERWPVFDLPNKVVEFSQSAWAAPQQAAEQRDEDAD